MPTLFYHSLTYHLCGIIFILYSYREELGMMKTLTTLVNDHKKIIKVSSTKYSVSIKIKGLQN